MYTVAQCHIFTKVHVAKVICICVEYTVRIFIAWKLVFASITEHKGREPGEARENTFLSRIITDLKCNSSLNLILNIHTIMHSWIHATL